MFYPKICFRKQGKNSDFYLSARKHRTESGPIVYLSLNKWLVLHILNQNMVRDPLSKKYGHLG